jgi:rhodanese-related sulfurtransferase
MTDLAANTTHNSLHYFGPDYLTESTGSQGTYHHTASSLALVPDATNSETVLNQARQQALELQLPFAGSISPPEAWKLTQDHAATLVDVRTNEERHFVGYIPKSLHVAWATGTQMNKNPRFVKELEAKIKDKAEIILLLCRSGKRSAAAAQALTKAGFTNVFNVQEGFEGELNASLQRGLQGGWRWHNLPWVQE